MAPFDLSLRAGRGLGLSGLLGSGPHRSRQTRVRRDPARFRPAHGRRRDRWRRPRRAIRCASAIAFCPEDRKAEGMFAELTVRENIVLGLQTKRGLAPSPVARGAGGAGAGHDRGARHRHARRGQAGRAIVGRQPAEGGAGARAHLRAAHPHPRRADARHRRRRPRRDRRADPEAVPRRARAAGRLVRARRARRRQRPDRGAAGPPQGRRDRGAATSAARPSST